MSGAAYTAAYAAADFLACTVGEGCIPRYTTTQVLHRRAPDAQLRLCEQQAAGGAEAVSRAAPHLRVRTPSRAGHLHDYLLS